MKDKVFKRRTHIDWNDVRLTISDCNVDILFWPFKCNHPDFTDNRISYICMLTVYGKKKLSYFRHTGDYSIFGNKLPVFYEDFL